MKQVFRSKKQIKLVILHTTCFLHRAAKYADLQICKDKTFGNLNQIIYLQVSWLSRGCRKKYHCMILRADSDFLKILSRVNSVLAYWLNKSRIKKRSTCGNFREDCVGKLKLLQGIVDEPMFLPSPNENLHCR